MLSKNTVIQDTQHTIDAAVNGALAQTWTALPAIVTKYNPVALTVEAQPAIQGRVMDIDGTVRLVNLPLLLDCPVCFPHAGACSLTFPIQPGDECLIVFADRAIDVWWQLGGVQPPAEVRMHDLSDGFCLLAPWSQKTRITDVNTEEVELRTDDRKARVSMHPHTHQITIKTVGNVVQNIEGNVTQTVGGSISQIVSGNVTGRVNGTADITCPSITVNASKGMTFNTPILRVSGLISGAGGMTITGGTGGATAVVNGSIRVTEDVKASGISLVNHTHSGVKGGNSSTGAPQ